MVDRFGRARLRQLDLEFWRDRVCSHFRVELIQFARVHADGGLEKLSKHHGRCIQCKRCRDVLLAEIANKTDCVIALVVASLHADVSGSDARDGRKRFREAGRGSSDGDPGRAVCAVV